MSEEYAMLEFIQNALTRTKLHAYVNGIKHPGLSKNYFQLFADQPWDSIIVILKKLEKMGKINIKHFLHENGEEDFCIGLA